MGTCGEDREKIIIMIWGLLESKASFIRNYSNTIGRLWWFVQFVFRAFIVTIVGSQVFGDEQGKFQCDTSQPGCSNICFNRFSPISYLRLWAFQLVIVSMPKFMFWSYIDFIRSEQILIDNMKKKLYKSLSIEDMSEITEEHKVMMDRDSAKMNKILRREKLLLLQKSQVKNRMYIDDKGKVDDLLWTTGIRIMYIFHLIFQISLE